MLIDELIKYLITIVLTSSLAVVVSLYAHMRLAFSCKEALKSANKVYTENKNIEKFYHKLNFTYMDIDVANNVLFWVNKCLLLPTTTITANHLHHLKCCLIEYQKLKISLIKLPTEQRVESQQIKSEFLAYTTSCIAYIKLLSFISPFERYLVRSWANESPHDLKIFVDKYIFSGENTDPKKSKSYK